MRTLKVLVVVMGVLLVGGTVALVAAVIGRAGHLAATAAPAVAASGGVVAVDLPAGARVVSSTLAGDRVLVHVALSEGGAELLLFDARSGARVASILLRSGAAP